MALVLGGLLAASLSAVVYLTVAPAGGVDWIIHDTVEEQYSSASVPEPVKVVTTQRLSFGDLIRREIHPPPSPRVARRPTPTPKAKATAAQVAPSPRSPTSPQSLPEGGVSSEIEYAYYDIYGTDESTLRSEMNQKGHHAGDGEVYDAHTEWNIGWKYWFKQEKDSCSVGSVRVTVMVKLNLPRWQDSSGAAQASESLRSKWKQFSEALLIHENIHKDYAITAGQEIHDAILRLPGSPGCDELKTKVSETGKIMVAGVATKNEKFDADTDHGRTQGAIFP